MRGVCPCINVSHRSSAIKNAVGRHKSLILQKTCNSTPCYKIYAQAIRLMWRKGAISLWSVFPTLSQKIILFQNSVLGFSGLEMYFLIVWHFWSIFGKKNTYQSWKHWNCVVSFPYKVYNPLYFFWQVSHHFSLNNPYDVMLRSDFVWDTFSNEMRCCMQITGI